MLETASFFLLHGFSCGEYVYLDETFLKWVEKESSYENYEKIPKKTPKKYKNVANNYQQWQRYKPSNLFSINSKVAPKSD